MFLLISSDFFVFTFSVVMVTYNLAKTSYKAAFSEQTWCQEYACDALNLA